ncbi:hypothetical protein [Tissierella sp. Yu-01]|nr:hypothetical protein [Tissierella sp. Yu-01]WFA10345.1 hypothetical protein P3962_07275 [Tissierella sp. Yu-01]
MKIGVENYESIIITDSEGGVLAIVSDKEIIEHEGYKVILEPTDS